MTAADCLELVDFAKIETMEMVARLLCASIEDLSMTNYWMCWTFVDPDNLNNIWE